MDSQTESILFLTDESDQPARIGFHVVANGVTYYLTSLKLNPHETRAINIRKLRDAQKTDFLKNRVPADATDGSVEWNRIDNVAVTGRVVVIQKNQGAASAYDCCMCPCPEGYYGLSATPSPSSYLIPGGVVLVIATGAYRACNHGPTDYVDVSWEATYASLNPSVAYVNPNEYGEVVGVSAGTSTISVSWSDYIYTYNGSSCNGSLTPHLVYCSVSFKPTVTSISPSRGLIAAATILTIHGAGFGSSPSVSAGSGIAVSISSSSTTSITGTFNVASTAPSGNHSVTVTAGGQSSNSVNFYVQVPKKLIRLDYPGAPGGVGPLVVITDGNVVNLGGQVLLQHQCGVYRNYAFSLVDQDSPAQPISGTYRITAHFTNYVGPSSPPSDNSQDMTPSSLLSDIQFFGKTAPSCPGSDDHESFDISNFVNAGGPTGPRYDLTTVIHIGRGNFSGTPKVDSTITVP